MPGLRPLEFHPFTIASTSTARRLDLLIQARSGFSRTLYKSATAKQARSTWKRRAFISGPWGTPPDISDCETAVFIACSTGATFIIPLLQDLMQRETCLRNITLHWIIRSQDHSSWFESELQTILHETTKQPTKTRLQINIHVTNPTTAEPHPPPQTPPRTTTINNTTDFKSPHSPNPSTSSTSTYNSSSPFQTIPLNTENSPSNLTFLSGRRPSIPTLIRPPVESALGETAIVVCGGTSITAQARTFVAKLSDERAVHKGTGAQGIRLWTETYGW
ncbi:hypothetical protein BST61_g1080 [Cercospora zeina]